ncbi:MAG: hypothetical protein HYZ31_08185 [Gammaproteobacteria bacterium]|nr:hypothetical protein [Gammaproteobacteria bacterium]
MPDKKNGYVVAVAFHAIAHWITCTKLTALETTQSAMPHLYILTPNKIPRQCSVANFMAFTQGAS